MFEIREERPADIAAIRAVNEQAFGQTQEADLVDALRRNCRELLSLVAVVDGQIVGHLLFSPATIAGDTQPVQGMGLAPVAVLPARQRQGIGSRLIRHGIERLRDQGCPFVIVLGHPGYYPRFGFEPASRHGVRSEWEVPDDAFMLLILDRQAMAGISGLARYRPEFSALA